MTTPRQLPSRRAFTLVEIWICVIIVAVVWLGFISWQHAKAAERAAMKAAIETGAGPAVTFTNQPSEEMGK